MSGQELWARLPVSHRGVDVSHHQRMGALHWPEIARHAGWLVARAAYGTRADKTFADHIAGARASGMRVGAYLYYRQTQDREAQLSAFLRAINAAGGLRAGDISPTLDVEHKPQHEGALNVAKVNDDAAWLCDELAFRCGVVIPYTYTSHALVLGMPDWLTSRRAWIAEYGPRVRYTGNWLAWQFTGSGSVPGSSGVIDMNVSPEGMPFV